MSAAADLPTPLFSALTSVINELVRQQDLAIGGDTESFDAANNRNDWVAYVSAYVGRAADKCLRNEREDCDFRENMVKTAALAIAAIRAHDAGHC